MRFSVCNLLLNFKLEKALSYYFKVFVHFVDYFHLVLRWCNEQYITSASVLYINTATKVSRHLVSNLCETWGLYKHVTSHYCSLSWQGGLRTNAHQYIWGFWGTRRMTEVVIHISLPLTTLLYSPIYIPLNLFYFGYCAFGKKNKLKNYYTVRYST